ncbi:MAG: NAD(P)-dependent dehydrogenase (short-subunit alcohol dehydrogenase family) [Rhodothermales bacterium]
MRQEVTSVIATYRNESSHQALLAIADNRLKAVKLDVTDDDTITALAERLGQDLEVPNLVIHAAGILHEGQLQPEKSLRQCDRVSLQRIFEVNSIGPLLLARSVIPRMAKQKPGQYAVLSAMVGSIGDNRLGGWYGYRASKAAVNQFIRTMAIETRRTHPELCISAIHPGTTDTELSRPFQSNVSDDKLYTTTQSAQRILNVISSGSPEQSGRFMNWDGNPIPW